MRFVVSRVGPVFTVGSTIMVTFESRGLNHLYRHSKLSILEIVKEKGTL